MANTGQLPSAADLRSQAELRGSYGNRLFFQKQGQDIVELIDGKDRILVEAKANRVKVDLELLDALTVPYVNAFIAHTSQRVEKYWRTKRYRIVETQTTTPLAKRERERVVVESAPQSDILDALLASTTPRDQARQLRRLAILIHAAAEALDAKASVVTAMDDEAVSS